jgi:hypothetical protein
MRVYRIFTNEYLTAAGRWAECVYGICASKSKQCPLAAIPELRYLITPQEIAQQQQAFESKKNDKPMYNAEEGYDPWGKGGGGAPLKVGFIHNITDLCTPLIVQDRSGRMVTDRSKMAGAWNHRMDTNIPHDYKFTTMGQPSVAAVMPSEPVR